IRSGSGRTIFSFSRAVETRVSACRPHRSGTAPAFARRCTTRSSVARIRRFWYQSRGRLSGAKTDGRCFERSVSFVQPRLRGVGAPRSAGYRTPVLYRVLGDKGQVFASPVHTAWKSREPVREPIGVGGAAPPDTPPRTSSGA